MLHDDQKFKVKNFGLNGKTMMKLKGSAYEETQDYKDALDFKPDIVVLMLGTNDSKEDFWN